MNIKRIRRTIPVMLLVLFCAARGISQAVITNNIAMMQSAVNNDRTSPVYWAAYACPPSYFTSVTAGTLNGTYKEYDYGFSATSTVKGLTFTFGLSIHFDWSLGADGQHLVFHYNWVNGIAHASGDFVTNYTVADLPHYGQQPPPPPPPNPTDGSGGNGGSGSSGSSSGGPGPTATSAGTDNNGNQRFLIQVWENQWTPAVPVGYIHIGQCVAYNPSE